MTAYSSGSAFQHRAAKAGLTAPLLRVVIDRFYMKVRQDSVLGPIFEEAIGDSWDSHIDKIFTFWLTATRLGSGYKGSDFLPAHLRIPTMARELLPRWLSLFRETAGEACTPEVADALIDIAERMAEMIGLALAEREKGRPC